ncbi:MAG: hypothetical protein R6W96_05320 [Clostridia bacterium]
MKEDILSLIRSRLDDMGVTHGSDATSDIVIRQELIRVGWALGSKAMVYEARILAEEKEKTLLMFEKKTEKTKGIFLEARVLSYHQKGRVPRRKEAVGITPGGKADGIRIVHGEIMGMVRDITVEKGWAFRPVLQCPEKRGVWD